VNIMSIFSLDNDKTDKKDEFATPLPKKEIKKDDSAQIKQDQIKKMSGFSSIKDVASAAPSRLGERETLDSPAVTRRLSSPRKLSKAEQEAQEKEEKLERKRRALKTVGRRYAKWLAENPYKMWAAFADDDDLKLNPEESAELTEAYFELAEALEPDLTSPWVIGVGILAMNTSLVTTRLKHIRSLEEKEKKPPTTGHPDLPSTIGVSTDETDDEEEENIN
jgi:hypothetical protein